MSPSPSNYLFKIFYNTPFVCSILFLQLNLGMAQEGTNSPQLPPLTSNAEKLAVLLQIKEKVPNLLSDAAKYDIDVFALLEDENKLLNSLKTNPTYLELLQHKKYHEITITPPPRGLEIGEGSIDPLAIQEWKEQLKSKLNQFKSQWGVGDESSHLTNRLGSEITTKLKNLTQATPSLDANALLKNLGKIKANQTIINATLKEKGAKTLTERLSATLKVYDQLPEKPSPFSKENLVQALELEQNREDLKSLIELHSVLDQRGQNVDSSSLSWQSAEASLNALSVQDLTSLQEKEVYLRPIINRLIPLSHPELQEEMLKRIHKNISSFATRIIRSHKKAIDPVTISQQHPVVGIFRGCTGGDCSSHHSFPFLNDPSEKVFFILDQDKKVKGYVSATQVMAGGKPSLYVITVSGSRVTSADTELIFRGLEKEKANLGVDQILLPAPDRIGSLINFPAPRSVYERYTASQPTIRIQYIHPEIRNEIENYESDNGYNDGRYDHMDQNTQAVVLNFKKNSGNEKISTQIHELSSDFLPSSPLNSISIHDVFEFLMDLKRSGRYELEEKVLRIDQIRQFINLKKYQELTRLIYKGPFEKPMTVQQFKIMLTHQLSELNRSLSAYLEKDPSIIYPSVFFCTDAFSPENIEETAKYVIKRLKNFGKNSLEHDPIWSSRIKTHLPELNHTQSFQKFKEDLLFHLNDSNPTARKNILNYLEEIKANDPVIHSSIAQVALQDVDEDVRRSALALLTRVKPNDSSIHLAILQVALHDFNKNIRKMALEFLKEIKSSHPEVNKGLLRIAIEYPDSTEKALAIQTLEEVELSNDGVYEALRIEILKNLNGLNHRQDLLPIVHRFMLPDPIQTKTRVNEKFCQSLKDILDHDKNLKSLMEFFADHSGALGIAR